MTVKFARIAWRENKFSDFNKFTTVETKYLTLHDSAITPASTTDYKKTSHYNVILCECIGEDDQPEPCSDLNECENIERYQCKILCLGGNFLLIKILYSNYCK